MSVQAPEKAEAHTAVHFTVTYDSATVRLTSLKANGTECGEDDAGWYFLMPEEAVTLTVEAETLEPEAAVYPIKNTAPEAIALVGLPSEAAAGATVRFHVLTLPGYDFNGLSVIENYQNAAGEKTLDFEEEVVDGVTWYSFVMPEANIAVKPSFSRVSFEIRYDSDRIYRVEQLQVGAEYPSTCNDGVAEFGATITVTTTDNDRETVKAIRIVETGQEYPVEDNEATFIMPARSVTLEPVTDLIYRSLTVTDSDHIDIAAYSKAEDGTYTEIDKAVAGDTVYVKATSESEDYSVRSLTVTYTVTEEDYYWGGTTTSTKTIDLLDSDPVDGYYSFEMPAADSVTTIEVTESDMTKFEGYPFVGSYLGVEVRSYYPTATDSAVSDRATEIGSDGHFVFDSSYSDDYYITSATSATGEGTAELNILDDYGGSDSGIFAYNDKLIFSNDDMDNLEGADYNYFYVKKQSPDDPDSLYTVDFENFGEYEEYTAIQFYRDGQKYAAAFWDYNKTLGTTTYHLDVEFQFTSGTKVTDDDASYTVMEGDSPLCKVSYTGEGGQENRFVTDGLEGDYAFGAGSEDLGSLKVYGNGQAEFNGKTCNYTYDSETGDLTLIAGGNKYVLSLNMDEGTYDLVSYTLAANDYMGYTFSGVIGEGWDTYNMSVSFTDETHAKMKVSTSNYDYIPNGNWHEDAEETYSIDPETGAITLNTYDSDGDPIVLILTPNEDKTALTVDKDINSIYPSGGAVLTRE